MLLKTLDTHCYHKYLYPGYTCYWRCYLLVSYYCYLLVSYYDISINTFTLDTHSTEDSGYTLLPSGPLFWYIHNYMYPGYTCYWRLWILIATYWSNYCIAINTCTLDTHATEDSGYASNTLLSPGPVLKYIHKYMYNGYTCFWRPWIH